MSTAEYEVVPCPKCGEKHNIGYTEVYNQDLRRIIPTYYCRTCLTEYKENGVILNVEDEDYAYEEKEKLCNELRIGLWSGEITMEMTKAELRKWFNKIGMNGWCKNLNLIDAIEIAEDEGFTITT